MRIAFHPDAEFELNEYASFYETEIPGLGVRFLDEAQRLSDLIAEHPYLGQEIEKDFPHSYIYKIEEDRIWVLAVAHHKRIPEYWRERITR